MASDDGRPDTKRAGRSIARTIMALLFVGAVVSIVVAVAWAWLG